MACFYFALRLLLQYIVLHLGSSTTPLLLFELTAGPAAAPSETPCIVPKPVHLWGFCCFKWRNVPWHTSSHWRAKKYSRLLMCSWSLFPCRLWNPGENHLFQTLPEFPLFQINSGTYDDNEEQTTVVLRTKFLTSYAVRTKFLTSYADRHLSQYADRTLTPPDSVKK